MKWLIFAFSVILLSSFANAAPTLSDSYPRNNSFFGRGAVNFSINVSSSTLDTNSVRLFVISEDAYQNSEPWSTYLMQCSTYATDSWNCSSSISFSIVASDTLEFFYFEANDSSGKGSLGDQNASLRFKIDRTPSVVKFVTPLNSSYVSGNVSVKITATDTVSGVNASSLMFSTDNSAWSPATNSMTSFDSSAFADNSTVFLYVRASDNVGNTNTTSINVTTDNEKPAITIILPLNGATVKDSIALAMNVSDVYSGINPSSANVAFGGSNFPLTCSNNFCSSAVSTTFVMDGAYTIVFSISDIAGNTNASNVTITTKNSKPSISLKPSSGFITGARTITATITNPNGTVTNTSLKIVGGTDVTNTMMECNSGFTSCTYNWNTMQFADGAYTLTASAGNTLNNNITASAALTVDNTRPSITGNIPDVVKTSFTVRVTVVDTNYNSKNINFTFDDNKVLMTCLPQGSTLFCEADYNPSYLVDGQYASNVTAVDKAGNSFTLEKTIALDSKPPEIRFTKIEPISSQTQTDVVFTIGAEDKGTDVNSVTIIIKTGNSQDTIPLTRNGNVWSARVAVNSGGGHTVDVYTDDLSGNSKTYEKLGYFFIGGSGCGDNICQSSENYCICAADCPAPACSNELDCSSGLPMCAAASNCGDRICSQDQTCNSCLTDCVSCNVPVVQPINTNNNHPGTRPNENPNNNPLGTGNGSFSEFITSNPLLVGTIGAILIAAAVVIIKFRKPKYAFAEKKDKPFIFGDKK